MSQALLVNALAYIIYYKGGMCFMLKWAGMTTSTVWCGKTNYDKLCVNGT